MSQIFLKNKSTDFLRKDLVFTDKGLKAETKILPVGPEVASQHGNADRGS